jgi:hypothetical protein
MWKPEHRLAAERNDEYCVTLLISRVHKVSLQHWQNGIV